jgi:ABC-type multidrug transport system fused ATPase/permease subunit
MVAESVRMAEEVHAFGAAEAERHRMDALVRSFQDRYVRTRTLSATVPVLYQSAVIFLLVAGLGILYALGSGQMAALGAVVLLLVRASAYGQQLQTAYQGLGESLPYLDRMTNAIQSYTGTPTRPGHIRIDALRTIEFRSVSFAYRKDVPVLCDLSFAITAGEAIGVVGPTGAGKSTLLQVLLRLREPSAGAYLINGVPVSDLDDADWHRRVAYLPQEPHLLDGTVAENIRFFRDWIPNEAVERAARLAHIHEDVLSWPDGYDTFIGHRVDAISGGQRQRICLARALAGAPQFLILDEPTSALDPHSERLIQESLDELHGKAAMLVIAHRISTLKVCDRVMVIRRGCLEAFAPVDLLYNVNEFYRNSVQLSTSGTPRP